VAATLSFPGCGGGGGGSSTAVPGTVTVVVSPVQKTLTVGHTSTFTATVTGNSDQAVTWSTEALGGGSITQAGLYTAPTITGTFRIHAASHVDSNATGMGTALVIAEPDATIHADDQVASGATGLTASVPSQTGAEYAWSIQGGTLDGQSNGYMVNYSAGAAGTLTLTCTVTNAAGNANTGTKSVTVTPPPPAWLVPASASLPVGDTRSFTWVVNPAGGTASVFMLEGAAGGTLAMGSGQTLTYTAPPRPGTYHLGVVNTAFPDRVSTATITVTPLPALDYFTATPATVPSGGQAILAAAFSNAALNTGYLVGTGIYSGGSIAVAPTTTTTYALHLFPALSTATTWPEVAALTLPVQGEPPLPCIAAANLGVVRRHFRLTLLADGTALATGGLHLLDNAPQDTAERYDPATGRFEPTQGAMTTLRQGHTATRLQDGRVLICGGSDGAGDLASAELYDPATGAFVSTGAMASPRRDHRAVLLDDGRVMVTGGASGAVCLASCEIYSPAAGVFQATGSMAQVRSQHEMALLGDGRVLVCGGSSVPGGSGMSGSVSAEVFDPGTDLFSPAAGSMAFGRYAFASAPLPSGKVLVVGGLTSPGHGPARSEVFDPAAGTFTAAAGLDGLVAAGLTASSLGDGRVLIAGGEVYAPGYPETPNPHAWAYDAVADTTTLLGDLALGRRTDHQAVVLTSGRVLAAGGLAYIYGDHGRYDYNYYHSAELLDPSLTPSWAVTVSPVTVAMHTGSIQAFSGQVRNALDPSGLTWSIGEVGGGSLEAGPAGNGTCLYTAPGAPGTYHLTASATRDPARSATATIRVYAPTSIVVTVDPPAPTVHAGLTVGFSATLSGASDPGVVWSVTEPGGGGIDASGLYTAPSVPGTYHVTATSVQDPLKTGTATVTVLP
jgi:hypothetical protein